MAASFRVSATAVVHPSDFASLLERAIERSGRGREIKQIEPAPTQAATE